MTTPEFDSDEMPTVIVSLNISEATNITMNGTRAKIFEKTPNEDASLNNIIIGIGLVAVALVLLVIIIKLIRKCYKECKEDDEDVKDTAKQSPLLPSSTQVAIRRKSSTRNPLVPIHRSSLNLETQIEIRQKRFSQPYDRTPPTIKKS